LPRTFDRLTPEQAARINQLIQQGTALLGNPATLTQGIAAICGARAYAFFASSGGNTALTGTNPLFSSNDGSACNSAPIGTPISPILPGTSDKDFSCQVRQFPSTRATLKGSSSLSVRLTICSEFFPSLTARTFSRCAPTTI
jgi:hypothetical protein